MLASRAQQKKSAEYPASGPPWRHEAGLRSGRHVGQEQSTIVRGTDLPLCSQNLRPDVTGMVGSVECLATLWRRAGQGALSTNHRFAELCETGRFHTPVASGGVMALKAGPWHPPSLWHRMFANPRPGREGRIRLARHGRCGSPGTGPRIVHGRP